MPFLQRGRLGKNCFIFCNTVNTRVPIDLAHTHHTQTPGLRIFYNDPHDHVNTGIYVINYYCKTKGKGYKRETITVINLGKSLTRIIGEKVLLYALLNSCVINVW